MDKEHRVCVHKGEEWVKSEVTGERDWWVVVRENFSSLIVKTKLWLHSEDLRWNEMESQRQGKEVRVEKEAKELKRLATWILNPKEYTSSS